MNCLFSPETGQFFQRPPEDEKQVIPVLIPDTIKIQSMYIVIPRPEARDMN